MSKALKSLTAWLDRRRGTIHDFVFPSRVDYLDHLSTRRYARLIDEWVSTNALDKREYGTHSMRRAKAALIYKAIGNLRAAVLLAGRAEMIKIPSVPSVAKIRTTTPSKLTDREMATMLRITDESGQEEPLIDIGEVDPMLDEIGFTLGLVPHDLHMLFAVSV